MFNLYPYLGKWSNLTNMFQLGGKKPPTSGFSIAMLLFRGVGLMLQNLFDRNWYPPWWILKLELLWRMATWRKSRLKAVVKMTKIPRDNGTSDEFDMVFHGFFMWGENCTKIAVCTCESCFVERFGFVLSWWCIFAELCSQFGRDTVHNTCVYFTKLKWKLKMIHLIHVLRWTKPPFLAHPVMPYLLVTSTRHWFNLTK